MDNMSEAQEDRLFTGYDERRAEEIMRAEDIEAERKGDIEREEATP